MAPLESYERITSSRRYRFKIFLKGAVMREIPLTPYFVTFLVGFACGIAIAYPLSALADEKKVFPLGVAVEMSGLIVCKELSDAKEFAQAMVEDTEESELVVGMKFAAGVCGPINRPLTIVYEKMEQDGPWRVYSFKVRGQEQVYYEITTWRHSRNEV